MQIHELHSVPRKAKKRIARGGKRGTYAGRGGKGQTARSGGNVNPLFEGGRSSLVDRLKKIRGFKSPHPKAPFVKLSDIARVFVAGETVSQGTLSEKKLLGSIQSRQTVKIIGTTKSLPKGLVFDGETVHFSEGALALVKQFGAKVEGNEKN